MMKLPSHGTDTQTKLVAEILTITVIALAALSFLAVMLTHYPFFDESMRVRFLWLMSKGLQPNIDYFTPHPSLGYILSLPLMSVLPDSAYSYLGLRFLSLLIFAGIGALFWRHGKTVCNDGTAGLTPFLLVITAPAISNYCAEYSIDHISTLFAFAAFCLMFAERSSMNLFLMAAASTASVIIMPKFLYPLFLGAAGTLAAVWLGSRSIRKTVVPATAGIALALTGITVIYWFRGISPWYDFDHSFLLHARMASQGNSNVAAGNDPSTLRFVFEHLWSNPLLLCVVAAGMAGFTIQSIRGERQNLFVCTGILVGALISAIMMRSFLEQYVTPVLLCSALLVPFAFSCVHTQRARYSMKIIFGLLTIITLTIQFKASLQQFSQTPYNGRGNTAMHQRLLGSIAMVPPGLSKLADYDRLLSVIPPNERIAAVWPYHPVFRRDVAVVTFDDIPTHALGLRPDDPLRNRFNPELYRATLQQNPPAYIVPMGMEVNYPPGWLDVTMQFLEQSAPIYKVYGDGYLRSDLVPNTGTAQ